MSETTSLAGSPSAAPPPAPDNDELSRQRGLLASEESRLSELAQDLDQLMAELQAQQDSLPPARQRYRHQPAAARTSLLTGITNRFHANFHIDPPEPPPSFDPDTLRSSDPVDFFSELEEYCRLTGRGDDLRRRSLLTRCCGGRARLWLEAQPAGTTYEELKRAFLARAGQFDDPPAAPVEARENSRRAWSGRVYEAPGSYRDYFWRQVREAERLMAEVSPREVSRTVVGQLPRQVVEALHAQVDVENPNAVARALGALDSGERDLRASRDSRDRGKRRGHYSRQDRCGDRQDSVSFEGMAAGLEGLDISEASENFLRL